MTASDYLSSTSKVSLELPDTSDFLHMSYSRPSYHPSKLDWQIELTPDFRSSVNSCPSKDQLPCWTGLEIKRFKWRTIRKGIWCDGRMYSFLYPWLFLISGGSPTYEMWVIEWKRCKMSVPFITLLVFFQFTFFLWRYLYFIHSVRLKDPWVLLGPSKFKLSLDTLLRTRWTVRVPKSHPSVSVSRLYSPTTDSFWSSDLLVSFPRVRFMTRKTEVWVNVSEQVSDRTVICRS